METAEQQLARLRSEIDRIDEALARLFIERIGIIGQVAKLKAEHWPKACHIRPGREGQMHRAIAKRFADSGFPPLMALAIWRQLIGGSTHLESPLNTAYLSDYPEHQFLAREYFGVQAGTHAIATLSDALKLLQSGKANILILPHPEKADWWKQGDILKEAGLAIFAALPVEENNLPKGSTPAVALAVLTPEDSGDDISYHLREGQLLVKNGFMPDEKNALFLGAHPRPIRLTSGVMYA